MLRERGQLRSLGLCVDDGPTQLATTEAIIDAVGRGKAPPTLRLYSWSEPVVIIGVGQPIADVDLDAIEQRGFRLLRRIGGGTAVYHDENEVSLDLILPADHELAFTDVHRGYDAFSSLLVDWLAGAGVIADVIGVEEARNERPNPMMRPLCFGSISPYELRGDGKKLAGLCQVRRRGSVTYQVAIYRRFEPEPLIAALRHPDDATRAARLSWLDQAVTDLESLAGSPVDLASLAGALLTAVAARGFSVEIGNLTESERRERDRLIAEKYASSAWTFRR